MSLQTASPKTKVPMRLGMSVKGMQQIASIRSLSARESRKELVTVRRRRFRSSTATTRAFPQTLSTKISVYSRTRTVRSRSAGGRVTGCHADTLVAPQQGRAAWLRCPPRQPAGILTQAGSVAEHGAGTWAPPPAVSSRLGGELGAGHPGSLHVDVTTADVGPGCPGCSPARLHGHPTAWAGFQRRSTLRCCPCPVRTPGLSPRPCWQDVAACSCPWASALPVQRELDARASRSPGRPGM